MNQKISPPVAIVIIVVVVLLVCFGLYRRFMYQRTYTAADVAASFKSAAAKMHAPPNTQPQQQNGKP